MRDDDYFSCGAWDCPMEHPIPGMTCPDEDEARLAESDLVSGNRQPT